MTPPSDPVATQVSQANVDDWVRSLFERVDARDVDGWLEYLSDDVRFRFGNALPLAGKDAIRDGVRLFFSSLSAIRHHIAEVWKTSDTVICRGEVTYARRNGSTLTVPFANVFKLEPDGLVREYLIYADTSEL